MRRTSFALLLMSALVALSCAAGKTVERPAGAQSLPVADPFILCESGTYYLYGTGAANGIAVYVSSDLHSWSGKTDLALHKKDSYGEKWFWAPEVYHVGDKYYMYYSAQERICVATSSSPTGPFVQAVKEPIVPYGAIDNSLFFDKDGQPWIFFVKFNGGNQVWSARLEDDLLHIKPGSEKKCLEMSQEWERIWPTVNEGPFVLYHDGLYYLTYSANSYESPLYGIGYATASSLDGLGPSMKATPSTNASAVWKASATMRSSWMPKEKGISCSTPTMPLARSIHASPTSATTVSRKMGPSSSLPVISHPG